jgi:hypothetical protein
VSNFAADHLAYEWTDTRSINSACYMAYRFLQLGPFADFTREIMSRSDIVMKCFMHVIVHSFLVIGKIASDVGFNQGIVQTLA